MESSRVAAIPLFADLPEDEVAAVAGVVFEIEIPSGQALAAEGHMGHSLFAVESGTADVVMEGATVRTIGTGDVVGEIAVFASPPDPFAAPEVADGGLRTASVVATSPMRLIAMFKRDVWAGPKRAGSDSTPAGTSGRASRTGRSARAGEAAHRRRGVAGAIPLGGFT